ncbi:MAG: hypothetical protein GWO04_47110, partial [Actinobacteria bacterium]|nr:hypothetical protein [Actinomycetota bacterium]
SLDFPTIPDPDTSAGQPGDIDLADPAELRAAIRACDAAWVDRLTEDSLPGIVVINARTLGSSPGYGTPNGVPGGDFAADATWTPGYV